MPGPRFFSNLGLFVAQEFGDAQTCATFRSEMCSGTYTRASVVDGESSLEKVTEDVRRTNEVTISRSTAVLVKSRLMLLKPRLEIHFNLLLAGCEKPQFLIYKEGDFFLPHQDGDDEPDKPEYIKKRRLSLVVYLNKEAQEPEPDAYCGGSLTFYGLIDDPRWKKYGFRLTGEAGLVVAFRSDVLHEVTAVTRGTRYSIVTWFF